MPPLTREDRISLYQYLYGNARWDFDFFILMLLSTAIAALGLLINSTAVVIGAMLVAPLMLPLLGAGLSLALVNKVLLRQSITAVTFGFSVAFMVGLLAGAFAPMAYLNDELLARGHPNFFDLLIALISGFAAAYCTARPNLSAALPGVAISAALVPPIATAGISLALGHTANAFGATILFTTNVIAIIIGAASSFWLAGVRAPSKTLKKQNWLTCTALALLFGATALGVQLMQPIMQQYKQQRSSVISLPTSLTDDLVTRLQKNDIVLIHHEAYSYDRRVKIILTVESEQPLSPSCLAEVQQLALEELKKPVELDVRLQWVQRIRPQKIPSMRPTPQRLILNTPPTLNARQHPVEKGVIDPPRQQAP